MKRRRLYRDKRPKTKTFPKSADPSTIAADLDAVEIWLKEQLNSHDDVHFQRREWPNLREKAAVLLVYCQGMSSQEKVNREAIPALIRWFEQGANPSGKGLGFEPVHTLGSIEAAVDRIFQGELVVFIDGWDRALSLDVADPPQRQTEESPIEPTVRGARDAFTESVVTNVSLIRKRLRGPSLCMEQLTVGKRSHTSVALMYIRDVIRPDVIEALRSRIKELELDDLDSSASLEKWLIQPSMNFFPVLDYTARPDFVTAALLRGRACLVVDGSPSVLIAPIQLMELLKSGEDNQFSSIFIPFQFALRWIGLFIAVFLPGFYVALTSFHQDQIPFPLLSTFVQSTQGVPFPTPLEVFIMLVLFELFKEAGLRLPSPIGQTLSVVGGLIIGDASIRSGLTSPSTVVAIAIAVVASFTLDNLNLNGAVSLLRMGVLLFSSLFGLLGFFVILFTITLYLSWLKPFGLPYLAPISPLSWKDLLQGCFGHRMLSRRPSILKPRDTTRARERGNQR
ncbi:spore germination protein [Desmospora activa]|uniref:GerA spore germination protein n=1 Tax=Desmospora activa DSM 45169 TaxID=1121389 RepID=A0A2T4ZCI1_9BACL|nr:spore germination protein [Desmospora activa]PTM59572.1 GerA spore germination protein [Desmospora activa DSM 45169]